MSIEKYKNILVEELKKENEESLNLNILKAKQELLNDEANKERNFELLKQLNGLPLNEQIAIINSYINEDNSNVTNGKEKTHSLSNPSIPKFMFSNNDEGFSNVILLSIALIILSIIILMIIFV